jgi:hypothetical protein
MAGQPFSLSYLQQSFFRAQVGNEEQEELLEARCGVVAHTYNPSTQKAKEGGS